MDYPEILVTDKRTEFKNKEIITLCYLYNIKYKPRRSHAPWTDGLIEGMNRSLQEYLRCIINGNDTRNTEWSTNVKLFSLSYISQITTTLGVSPYEMVFNQKPQKPLMFTSNSKTHKVIANLQKNQFVIIYYFIHTMKIIFITQKLKLAPGTHTE